jgi:hypothetical protein
LLFLKGFPAFSVVRSVVNSSGFGMSPELLQCKKGLQAAKAKARGYRNSETLKAVTYMVAGKLDLRLPT